MIASRSSPLRDPHTTLWLPEDPSCTFQRGPLWAVHLFHLLTIEEASALVQLAETHAAAHGWSTRRHAHHPTTDISVESHVAPALHSALQPLVDDVVLPTLALHYDFERAHLKMREIFLVKYEAGVPGVQDRLAPHRDGNLLSFSILLSDPASFDGGGLRFHSLGPLCESCAGGRAVPKTCAPNEEEGQSLVALGEQMDLVLAQRAAADLCPQCNGVGRLAVPGCGIGDLTTHCGKLLHEGAPVLRGTRYVVVGFVNVDSPTVDVDFIAHSALANSSTVGRWADHECVGAALLTPPPSPQAARSSGVIAAAPTAAPRRRGPRGGDDDMMGHLFGGM